MPVSGPGTAAAPGPRPPSRLRRALKWLSSQFVTAMMVLLLTALVDSGVRIAYAWDDPTGGMTRALGNSLYCQLAGCTIVGDLAVTGTTTANGQLKAMQNPAGTANAQASLLVAPASPTSGSLLFNFANDTTSRLKMTEAGAITHNSTAATILGGSLTIGSAATLNIGSGGVQATAATGYYTSSSATGLNAIHYSEANAAGEIGSTVGTNANATTPTLLATAYNGLATRVHHFEGDGRIGYQTCQSSLTSCTTLAKVTTQAYCPDGNNTVLCTCQKVATVWVWTAVGTGTCP